MIRTILTAVAAVVLLAMLGAGCSGPARGTGAVFAAESLYNGVTRPLWVRIADVPNPSIALIEPVTGAVVAEAPAPSGRADLGAVLPMIWVQTASRVLYAQLLSGGRPVGAALVLQPMLGVRTAVLVEPSTHRAYWIDDATGKPEFEGRAGVVRYYSESPIVNAGLRVYPESRVVLDTSLGEMEFAMRPDAAPNTAFNFEHLVGGGFYREILFHRVVPVGREGHPFVIQVGDPTGTGDGGPGYAIDLEQTTLAHDFGVISMARDSEPNTNGSQVFVCLSREGTARLDGKYCAFGQLTRGADVVRAIAATPLKEGTDRPVDPPVLRAAWLIEAPPRPVRASP